jgi:AcrR family transcriptional regulator
VGTEEKLILAAVNQFKLHGFNGATTKAIAAEAGVAEVTLFRYFGDKRTLFIKMAAYIAVQFGIVDIPNGRTGDFRQDMLRLCRNLLRHFVEYNALFRMLIFEAKKHEDIRSVLVDFRGRAIGNMQKLADKYTDCKDGKRMTDSVEWLANSLMGASLCYCLFHDTEDQDTFIRTHAGMIANAFTEKLTAGK